jgi:hypothetical protein
MNSREWNIFQAAEMNYTRAIGGYTKIDRLRNEDIMKWVGFRAFI